MRTVLSRVMILERASEAQVTLPSKTDLIVSGEVSTLVIYDVIDELD